MRFPRSWLTVPALFAVAGCTSAGASSDSWSRTYFASRDRVIDAVIEVLEAEEYLVEADREKGRISAQPSQRSGGNLALLEVRVKQKDDRILVDVQTRTGATYSTLTSKPANSQVIEFLFLLDRRLQGSRN